MKKNKRKSELINILEWNAEQQRKRGKREGNERLGHWQRMLNKRTCRKGKRKITTGRESAWDRGVKDRNMRCTGNQEKRLWGKRPTERGRNSIWFFSKSAHSPSTEKYALPESCTTFEGSNRENFSFTGTPERETRPKQLQCSAKKRLMKGEGVSVKQQDHFLLEMPWLQSLRSSLAIRQSLHETTLTTVRRCRSHLYSFFLGMLENRRQGL